MGPPGSCFADIFLWWALFSNLSYLININFRSEVGSRVQFTEILFYLFRKSIGAFVFFSKDGAIKTPGSHATRDFSVLLSSQRLYRLLNSTVYGQSIFILGNLCTLINHKSVIDMRESLEIFLFTDWDITWNFAFVLGNKELHWRKVIRLWNFQNAFTANVNKVVSNCKLLHLKSLCGENML